MLKFVTLKKGSVIVIQTVHPLEEGKADHLLKEMKQVFPDHQVLLPNGAELIILEPEE